MTYIFILYVHNNAQIGRMGVRWEIAHSCFVWFFRGLCVSPLHDVGGHCYTYLCCLRTGERMGRTFRITEQLHKAKIYHNERATLVAQYFMSIWGEEFEVVSPIPLFLETSMSMHDHGCIWHAGSMISYQRDCWFFPNGLSLSRFL